MNRKRALRLGALGFLILVVLYLFVFFGDRKAVPGTPYVFVIQPGVPDKSVRLAMTSLDAADQFLLDSTGRTVSETVEVRFSNFTPCSPLQPILPLAPTAEALGNRICVNTRSGVWAEALNENPGIAISVIAHEHYHSLQAQLGCLPSPWKKEYAWLIEGGAAYIGWETAITFGYLDRDWVNNLLEKMRTSDHNLGRLASYERNIDGDAAYSQAYTAVHQLITKTGSVASLNDFCVQVGQGTPWREAFAQVFGITPQDFYANFEVSQ